MAIALMAFDFVFHSASLKEHLYPPRWCSVEHDFKQLPDIPEGQIVIVMCSNSIRMEMISCDIIL